MQHDWINSRYSEKRHEKLRSLCTQLALDGILVIGGIDSLYSNTSQALLKYLFLETCGRELLGTQMIPESYEQIENVVLFITPSQTFIYYMIKSDSDNTILRTISQWQHVVEYVVRECMDTEKQEGRKIFGFRHMLHSMDDKKRRIGIPFESNCNDTVHAIEKWPLIQSFAQENIDVGQQEKGFFTRYFDVIDICSHIYKLFSLVDDHHANNVYRNVEPLLYHQFSQLIIKLDGSVGGEAMSEAAMAEDLLVFYEFGSLNNTDYELPKDRGCRVLFGSRSGDLHSKSSPDVYLDTVGPDKDIPATHFVVEIEDPSSGVRFCRTYFASTGKTCQRLDHSKLMSGSRSSFINNCIKEAQSNTSLLIFYYHMLVQAYEAGCKSFLKSLKAMSPISQCHLDAKDAAFKVMRLNKSDIPMPIQEILEYQLVWNVYGLDANGKSREIEEIRVNSEWIMLYLSLGLHHIPSCQETKSLGSLIIGDTFLVLNRSSKVTRLNVTQTFSYFSSWILSNHEWKDSTVLEDSLSSDLTLRISDVLLGAKVSVDDLLITHEESPNVSSQEPVPQSLGSLSSLQWIPHVTLLIDTNADPVWHGQMCLLSEGFAFKSSHFCLFWISFSKDVRHCKLFKTPHEDLSVLVLSLNPKNPISEVFPFELNEPFQLGIPVLAQSRFQKFIVRALECWKSAARAHDIPFERVEGDTIRASIFTSMADLGHEAHEMSPSIQSGGKKWYTVQKGNRLIDYTQAESIRRIFPNFTKPHISLRKTTINSKLAAEISIIVVIGLPGSGCTSVAGQICEMGSDNTYWTHIDIDIRDLSRREQHPTSSSLQTLIQKRLDHALKSDKEEAQPQKHRKILLSMTGYLDVVCLCGCLKRSIDELSSKVCLQLGAVITCVNLHNLYRPDPTKADSPLPYLTDQLSAGFTTGIVVVHALEAQGDLVMFRNRVNMCNPFAEVHLIPYNAFQSSVASLVNENAFHAKPVQQLRELFYQDWETETSTKPSNPHFCLETAIFQLKPGMQSSTFIGIVRDKLTPFSQAKNEVLKMNSSVFPAGTGKRDDFASSAYYFHRSCWCVEGTLFFSDDSSSLKRFVSTGTYYSRIDVHSEKQHLDERPRISITAPSSLLPEEDALHELLASCYHLKEESMPTYRDRSSITLEEKRALQTEHALDPLPHDFMYDGQIYVNFSGERLAFHPQMDQIIEEYLAVENEKTREEVSKFAQMKKESRNNIKRFVP